MVPPTIPRAWFDVVNPMLNPRRCGGNRFAGATAYMQAVPIPCSTRNTQATAYMQAVPIPCSTRNPTTDARSGERAMQNMETRYAIPPQR